VRFQNKAYTSPSREKCADLKTLYNMQLQ